jgi:hypothetical protein
LSELELVTLITTKCPLYVRVEITDAGREELSRPEHEKDLARPMRFEDAELGIGRWFR